MDFVYFSPEKPAAPQLITITSSKPLADVRLDDPYDIARSTIDRVNDTTFVLQVAPFGEYGSRAGSLFLNAIPKDSPPFRFGRIQVSVRQLPDLQLVPSVLIIPPERQGLNSELAVRIRSRSGHSLLDIAVAPADSNPQNSLQLEVVERSVEQQLLFRISHREPSGMVRRYDVSAIVGADRKRTCVPLNVIWTRDATQHATK